MAPDVRLGRGVKMYAFVNLYGCAIGDETPIGTFVEIQKDVVDRRALQDPEPHLHLRRRDDRGRGLRRPRRDVHQRPLPARHRPRRRAADRSRLDGGADAGEARRVASAPAHDPRRRDDRRRRHGRRGRGRHAGRAGPARSSRETRRGCSGRCRTPPGELAGANRDARRGCRIADRRRFRDRAAWIAVRRTCWAIPAPIRSIVRPGR